MARHSASSAVGSGGSPAAPTRHGGLPVDAVPQHGWIDMRTTGPDQLG
ncbi:MAG TPA: hypothetical protein VKF41_10950 [Bryobacteraceae bacterium]|nr:hypothetical protein [Bryobacteraceae bacterium]